jgi:hypothetical protein
MASEGRKLNKNLVFNVRFEKACFKALETNSLIVKPQGMAGLRLSQTLIASVLSVADCGCVV